MSGWHDALRALLESRLGFDLPADRLAQVVVPYVEARARACAAASPAEFVRSLASRSETDLELVDLFQVVRVGETYLFRDPDQLEAIATFAVALQRERVRPLAVWSAGCSTGEECFTLAMLFASVGVPATILGTDVDGRALVRARGADRISPRAARHAPPALRARYLRATGPHLALTHALREDLSFRQHNLVTAAPTPGDGQRWDLILCRNVFIYFSGRRIRRVAARLASVLADDGALFVGATDSLFGLELPLTRFRIGGQPALRRGPPSSPAPEAPAPRLAALGQPPALGAAAPRPRLARRPPAAPPPRRWSAPAEAIDLVGKGLFGLAAQCLDEHLARSPGDAAANLLRGNLHLHRHAFDDALQRYARAISAEPARADAHYLSAVAHHKRGDDAAAVAALEEALAHSETFWPAAFLLGTIQLRAGRRLQAEVAFEQAVAVLERPDRSPLLTASAGELVNSVHNDPAWALERARACLIAAAPQRATAEGRP